MPMPQNLYALNSDENLESFEQVISENEAKIINLIYGMTGDYHLSQDLAQETFIKAFKARHGFNGRSKFSTWLYRIAVNVTLDYQRKSCVRMEKVSDEIEPLDYSDQQTKDPDHSCQVKAMKDILFQAIAKLPEQQREVFTLREINRCSTKEVAQILNISLELVKWRLHKARTILRKSFGSNTPYQKIGVFRLSPHGID
ncbi:RNA polymerase sigma factor [Desulfitobacterium metallireducens]|uniref:RNA polymerase sigma factor n=1 Tax=Desulfitobacterium metallireducens DSM 15288 TaxID=871968 RepID=W0E5U5_9FIRM|nr:RNA polymerase sigma factor [Desulfitobacterium metallireducens]AHF06127.1 RNA polymerase subunit sigma-24 [Desulfitobacterium metallireducens DSM 15288]